jgi:Arginine methyltransferase-interacting protein, contains RING Zn-finger
MKQSPEPTKKVQTVFISKEGKSSKEVQCLVTTLVSPARDGIKVKRMRSTPKTLILETNDESDVAKLTTHRGLKNEQLVVEAPRKRNPLLIVYDVPRDIKDNELVNAIHDQNFGETDQEPFESQFRLRFKVGPQSKDTVHHVVEVTGPLRRHILGVRRLYVGFTSHAVKDYTVLPRCLRYQDLGHVTKHCRQTESVCAHCGEQGHTRGQCGKRGLPAVCIPCHARKKRCGKANSTGCQTYKLLWDRLVSRIYYG